MDSAAALLVLVVVLALAFDYINGFHDTANAVATVVSTNVLPGRTAVLDEGAVQLVIKPMAKLVCFRLNRLEPLGYCLELVMAVGIGQFGKYLGRNCNPTCNLFQHGKEEILTGEDEPYQPVEEHRRLLELAIERRVDRAVGMGGRLAAPADNQRHTDGRPIRPLVGRESMVKVMQTAGEWLSAG
jgi:hypothetical protein